MSYAPVTRKSSGAQAAALAKEAARQPAPHRVVLRVKRTRADAAVEGLVVAPGSESFRARKRRSIVHIEDSLSHLGLNTTSKAKASQTTDSAPRLFFKRVRTTGIDGSRKKGEERTGSESMPLTRSDDGGVEPTMLTTDLSTTPARSVSNYIEIRRVKAKGITAGIKSMNGKAFPLGKEVTGEYHVIDLQPVSRSEDEGDARMEEGPKDGCGAQSEQPTPLLNPLERQMDKAIFMAFQTGDMSSVRDTLASSPSLVNYQRRLGDGTTALMAASFHGDLETVRYLLSLGAKASAVDGGERSAAVLASTSGNRECFVELQRWARRQAGRVAGEGKDESSDYVYDLYYFEPGNAGGQTEDPMDVAHVGCLDEKSPAEAAGSGHTTPHAKEAPVVHLSGIGPVDADAVGSVDDELELQFEHDSDWSDLGEDAGEDPDSNSEGHYGNDYPDEGECDEFYGSSHLAEGCPRSSSSEMGSSDEGQLSSDEEEYPRRCTSTRAFGRTRVDSKGKPISRGIRWPEGGRLMSLSDPSVLDPEVDVLRKRGDVFAWDPRSVDTDEESL